jgi:hypothetical protein
MSRIYILSQPIISILKYITFTLMDSDIVNNNLNIMINVLMGVILGIIIYKGYICPPVVRGPNSRDIVDKIFHVGDKYYELEPIVCGCLKN